MNILVDENIPLTTIQFLRSAGHDTKVLYQTGEAGITDEAFWKLAQSEQRVLISTHGSLGGYRYWSHFGILIVRLKKPRCCKIHERVLTALNDFPESEWEWKNLVVEAEDETVGIFYSPERSRK